ncbi:MAG: universal stress protein [Methanomassiliicoccales archaeon]|jgi:nucleotide-binding universal stress UspA family protein
MSLYDRILIPTDGSEYTKAATMQGLEIAKLTGAEVTALFVVDDVTYINYPFGPMVPDLTTMLEEEGKKAVSSVRAECEKMGIKMKTLMKRGSPGNVIIEESKFFDLIVMGTLGRSGVSKLLLGSVAEKVIRFAQCPVLVVRNPEMHE